MSHATIKQPPENLTRKQRREQGRVQRKAAEAAASARALRRTRLTRLGIVLSLVLAGLVVVLISSAGAGTVTKVAPEGPEARAVRSEVSTLLAGLPQSGNLLGQPTAPVTLTYFGDLECPVCRSFTVEALPSIIQHWVRAGKLRIAYDSLETATREPEVFKVQQVAALAAGRQNKLWNFIETFYHEQQEEDSGYVTESYIRGIAGQVPGLNLGRWNVDRSDAPLAEKLTGDAQTANSYALNGTPGFLIGRSGGSSTKLEPSAYNEPGPFDEAIEKQLNG